MKDENIHVFLNVMEKLYDSTVVARCCILDWGHSDQPGPNLPHDSLYGDRLPGVLHLQQGARETDQYHTY